MADTSVSPSLSSLSDLEIQQGLQTSLGKRGLTYLSDTQQMALAPLFKGEHVVGEVDSAAGKTFAYVSFCLQLVVETSPTCQAVIVVPTRETVNSVSKMVHVLAPAVRCLSCSGATPLRRGVPAWSGQQLVVGTPEKVKDLLRGVDRDNVRLLVLDTLEVMLQRQQQPALHDLMDMLQESQVVVFNSSATPEVSAFTSRFVPTAARFQLTSLASPAAQGTHHCRVHLEEDWKLATLMELLAQLPQLPTAIFVTSESQCWQLCDELLSRNVAAGVHTLGEDQQVVVTTDPTRLKWQPAIVLNYDVPEHVMQYLQRVHCRGTCSARLAITFVTATDEPLLTAIELCSGAQIGDMTEDFFSFARDE